MHGSASTWTHLDLASYSIVGLNILLFVDEVSYLCEQMVWIVKNPCSYSGITQREKARGIKKTRGWEDFKVEKYAGLCLNDGWRIVLISVPWGEHVRERVTFSSHLCDREPGTEGTSKPAVITAFIQQYCRAAASHSHSSQNTHTQTAQMQMN